MIDILTYVTRVLNKDPIKKGSNYFIHSPFTNEKTPSFTIYPKTNSFFDWSASFGGDVIDLHRRLKNISRKDAYIEMINDGITNFSPSFIPIVKEIKEEKSNYKIIHTKELSDLRLIEYAKNKRGISLPIMIENALEMRYTINKADKEYTFNAIAFKNDSGGYEIRNEKTKLSFGKKDITTIFADSEIIDIFEGFFDYLTFLELTKSNPKKTNAIILNSVSMVGRVEIPGTIKKLRLWFDNDRAGKETTKIITEKYTEKTVKDMSYKYKGHSDLNNYHISQ